MPEASVSLASGIAMTAILSVSTTPFAQERLRDPEVLAADSPTVSVSILSRKGFSARDQTKVASARALAELVLNDACFHAQIVKGPPARTLAQLERAGQETIENTGVARGSTYVFNKVNGAVVSNRKVLERLLEAREPPSRDGKVRGTHEHMMEIGVRQNHRPLALWCAWPFYLEEGHRDPDTDELVVQDCHFRSWSAIDLAAFWVHEYMHILGFDHTQKPNNERSHSVPYFVGQLAEARASDLQIPCAGGKDAPECIQARTGSCPSASASEGGVSPVNDI
jgi:hypothetical protein